MKHLAEPEWKPGSACLFLPVSSRRHGLFPGVKVALEKKSKQASFRLEPFQKGIKIAIWAFSLDDGSLLLSLLKLYLIS